MANKDILLNDEGEILIENGDLKMGDSTGQEIAAMFTLNKGENKQYPYLGPQLIRKMNGKFTDVQIKQELKLNYAADGKNDLKISVTEGKINIEY